MILSTSIRGKEIRVIFDFDIQGNFISLETIKQLNILIQEKEKPYLLSIINRIIIKQDKGIIRYKTIPI
jgi:retron-type reverse transcriptase